MKNLLLTIFLTGMVTLANAQIDFDRFFSLSYDVNMPLSNKDYIKNTSMRGFQLGFRKHIDDHFMAGVDFSNASYNDYSPRQTYLTETGAITTDLYKYVYSYGVTVSGDYFFTPEKKLSPFAGLGLGANYNSYKSYYNIYSSTDSGWGLLVRPEAGVMLKMGERGAWGLIAAVHLDYATTKSADFEYDNFTNLGFRIGIVVMDW